MGILNSEKPIIGMYKKDIPIVKVYYRGLLIWPPSDEWLWKYGMRWLYTYIWRYN